MADQEKKPASDATKSEDLEKTVSSRRKVLTAGGAILLGAPIAACGSEKSHANTPAENASTPEQTSTSTAFSPKSHLASGKVIVVGGGFAGMTCARDLSRRGFEVTVLEARNRIGGRTFTADFNGEPTDMGGTWVHWMQPHVWSELRRYGVGLKETKGAVAERIIYIDYSGNRHETKASEIWGDFEEATRRYYPNAYEIFPRPALPFDDDAWVKADTKSVAQAIAELDATEEIKAIMDGFMTCMGASAPEEHAWAYVMRWYAHCGYNMTVVNDASARFKMEGGTKALMTQIAAEAAADLRLSTPVASVSQVGDKVQVVTQFDEKFIADAVVMAVPWNVLSDIEFSPALPKAKADVVAQGHVGNGVKVHALVEGEYETLSGYAPGGNAKINFLLWDSAKNGKTHFIGFGPSRDNLDVTDIKDVEAALRVWLPDAKVIQAYGYEWGIDPYSQGVWMVPRPGQFGKALPELQRSHGRVHFASADWANSWPGFIDGAIEQGILAAQKVQAQLMPHIGPGLLDTKFIKDAYQ